MVCQLSFKKRLQTRPMSRNAAIALLGQASPLPHSTLPARPTRIPALEIRKNRKIQEFSTRGKVYCKNLTLLKNGNLSNSLQASFVAIITAMFKTV